MEKYKLPQQELDIYESLRQPFAIYQFVDKRVVTLALSAGFCNLFGYENHADAYFDMNNDMYKDVHPDDVARIANAAFRFATEGGKYEVIYRVMPKGNTGSRVIHAFGDHVYTPTGERLAHVWYSDEGSYLHRDGQPGTELNQSLSNALHENSILKATQYDYLTGLPSMTYFFELAEVGKGIIKGKGGRPVMMYMDFSGMKFYNAKYGFGEGNKLLQSFAKILASTFGNEQCCRIGSDHFAAYDEEEGLDEKLQKMLLACRNINEGRSLPIHVGVYVSQNERVHTSFACDRAKLACAEIGGRVESAVNYYSKELSEKAIQKRYFVEHLDQAISENWIQIYLQPIVRAVNGQVCEVEALARWIDPERGFASPADFIPLLEDAGVIYKLDLYIVDKILEYIKREETIGIMIVPHSVNLSRSDFDACDIVEEIRRRVDDAGIGRDKLTIEITESMIGKGFTFMKEQVSRFQSLGFHVWMDDFGSGYSSLNVLQSIKFDLIKFDMLFMRRFYDGDTGKIILNELMGLANALGLDTVCEGVETEEQVRFLQEIGCSKLQGYYFSRPIPFETLRDLYDKNIQIKRENPAESEYYAYVGRANLLDLAISTGDEEEGGLKERNMYKVLDVLPIAILEVRGQRGRYIRSNLSYRDFVKRYFELDVIKEEINFSGSKTGVGAAFLKAIMQCRDTGSRTFFDEKMPDGTAVHALVRRLAENPVTGNVSVAIIVLSITEPDEETMTYAEIAKAFAADYYNIYLIDLNTNNYMVYASQAGSEEMTLERHGEDFFELSRRDAMRRIYEEDRETFVALFTKENVLRDIEKHGVFTMTYRLMDTGSPVYVNMKATRMQGGNRLIIGISNIDAHRKQEEEEKRLRQERAALGRIAALSPEFIVLYTVDPKTGHYTQFNPSSAFKRFGLAKQGEDFFRDVVLDSPRAIAPEDLENHLRMLTMENMLSEIKEHGFFTHHYHMLIDGERIPACLKATLFEEEDGEKIILGVTNDETEEFRRKLEEAKKIREMNQTISSLLDNMPGLTFTKDAETGVYLTCNQAFANYAHKVTPEGVAGLTDAQIFDAETAAHFVADDRIAIAKNEPHVFFEDVPDAAGNHRQLQTTKFYL